ncbi:hypothetical protein CPB83DRAFT_842550 [Crepidotus variabilis]|uniref:Uncharacterized protein n=1 Tax=Crepidotus variabilis TaxID=179855 RepID=A0A9P6ETH0_9AGAR|nr:hypothetical protein CPB83DRAFT_842550 [Crepidotus variabilis]
MKGHKSALCQLRSPSEDGHGSSDKENASVFEDEQEDADWFRASPPPHSPTPISRSSGHGARTVVASHAPSGASNTPSYPRRPMTPEASWAPPPTGVPFHRKNPYIINHNLKVLSPVRRTNSWVSTEMADDEEVEDIDTPTGSFSMTDSTSSARRGTHRNGASGPPQAVLGGPVVLDTAGNRILGIDLSTIGDNLKAILRQAEEAGLMAAIVRPRIGYNRGTIDVRDEADADKHTTVFVATGPDTLSINMVYGETLQKTKLMNDEIAGNLKVQGTRFWIVAFFVVFLATVFGVGVSKYVAGMFDL